MAAVEAGATAEAGVGTPRWRRWSTRPRARSRRAGRRARWFGGEAGESKERASTVVAPAATALALTPLFLIHVNATAALWNEPHAVLIPTSVARSTASAIWA
uniref:Uncharacterized protein n=1 Tax=Oryza barthii TaxID=65489 RepID=A0A0D3FSS5_9ORYZ